MAKINSLEIGGKIETLADFAQRYKILSSPQVIQIAMKRFTQRMDLILKSRMETLSSHPRETGLMQRSWELPKLYLNTHTGKVWSVYLLNTATVGKQAELKKLKKGHRKKKRIGRHNLKRYMPYVDDRTKFYTKQLRVIKNKVDMQFKIFIRDFLYNAHQKGWLTEDEINQVRKEFAHIK